MWTFLCPLKVIPRAFLCCLHSLGRILRDFLPLTFGMNLESLSISLWLSEFTSKSELHPRKRILWWIEGWKWTASIQNLGEHNMAMYTPTGHIRALWGAVICTLESTNPCCRAQKGTSRSIRFRTEVLFFQFELHAGSTHKLYKEYSNSIIGKNNES